MAANAPGFLRWHRLAEPTGAAEALVIVLCDPVGIANTQAFAARWRRVVPRCAFAGFEVGRGSRRMALAPVQEVVEQEARALGLGRSQIVMVGTGRAGQRVLDLVLGSALPDVHVIIVDLPSESVRVGLPPAPGSFRFVQHRRPDDPDGHRFDRTIRALREACLDIRTMIMPDDRGATERAVGAFLVELVARASRYPPPQSRARSAAPRPKDPA